VISVESSATIRLVGNLGRVAKPGISNLEHLEEVFVSVPVKLGTAIRKLEEQRGLSLPRESILILVNGVEANALEDLDTIINEHDQIVLVPIFHGGSTL
jgi:molybdopterin converting factor small subunit